MPEKNIYNLFENNPEWTGSAGLFGATNETHEGLEAFVKYIWNKKLENGNELPQNREVINPNDFLGFLKRSENGKYEKTIVKVQRMINANKMTRDLFIDFAIVMDSLELLDNSKLLIDKYENFISQIGNGNHKSQEEISNRNPKNEQNLNQQTAISSENKSEIKSEAKSDTKSEANLKLDQTYSNSYSQEDTVLPETKVKTKPISTPSAQNDETSKNSISENSSENKSNTPTKSSIPNKSNTSSPSSEYSRIEMEQDKNQPNAKTPNIQNDQREYQRLTAENIPNEDENQSIQRNPNKTFKIPENQTKAARRIVSIPNSKNPNGHRLGEIPRQRVPRKRNPGAEEERVLKEQEEQRNQNIPTLPIDGEAAKEIAKAHRPKNKKSRAKWIGALVGGGAFAGTVGAASAASFTSAVAFHPSVISLIRILFNV